MMTDFVARRNAKPRPTPSANPERTADVLVRVLVDAGVQVVFGSPGGTIAPLYDALLDAPGIRVVTTRHEAAAVFAAAGYARATGRIGVVLVTSGPGVINAMTGIASAYCDGVPVLVLAGEVARKNHGKGALQEGSPHHLNIIGMADHISKLALEIPEPNAAPSMLQRAIATALSGRPGPVTVTLPIDVTTALAMSSSVALEVNTSFTLPAWAVEDAVRHLVGHGKRRTIIFAGSGLRNGDGARKLLEFAERTQLPVMTTPKAKGVFPEGHPLSLGVFGLGGHPSTTAWLEAGLDVLLSIGTSLGDISTNGWSKLLTPREAHIHVDIDARQIGRTYATTLGIAAPAELFLDRMLELLPPPLERRSYGVRYYSDAEASVTAVEGRIAPQRALWELQQVLPPDSIYTCDSGEHFLFAVHYLRTELPDGFMVMSGLGSMGSGIGAALGVKLAHPHRPVAAICGDGGFAMAASEVSTAVAEKLPIIFVVMNDERLGMVELGHQALYGRSPSYSTSPMSIVALASALGAQTLAIKRPGQILGMESFLRHPRGPMVLDVRVDQSVRMPKNGRFEALGNAGRSKPVLVG